MLTNQGVSNNLFYNFACKYCFVANSTHRSSQLAKRTNALLNDCKNNPGLDLCRKIQNINQAPYAAALPQVEQRLALETRHGSAPYPVQLRPDNF